MPIFGHLWSPKMTEKKLNYFHLQVFTSTKPKFEGWMRFKPVLFLFSVVYKNGNKFREYFATNVQEWERAAMSNFSLLISSIVKITLLYTQISSVVTLYQSEGAKFCQPAVCQGRFFAQYRLAKCPYLGIFDRQK